MKISILIDSGFSKQHDIPAAALPALLPYREESAKVLFFKKKCFIYQHTSRVQVIAEEHGYRAAWQAHYLGFRFQLFGGGA